MEYENILGTIDVEHESSLDALREEVERTIEFISFLSSLESHNNFPDVVLEELKHHISCLLEIIRESLKSDLDQEYKPVTASIH